MDPTPRDVLFHIISYDIPVKYISPLALLGLFVNQIIVDVNLYNNGYKDYPNWLHGVVGGLVLGAMGLSLVIFAVYPDFWDVMGVDENQGAQVAFYAVRTHKLSCSFIPHSCLRKKMARTRTCTLCTVAIGPLMIVLVVICAVFSRCLAHYCSERRRALLGVCVCDGAIE